jgi:hypothetical protein
MAGATDLMPTLQAHLSRRLSAQFDRFERLLDRASMPRTRTEQEALGEELCTLSAEVRELRRAVGQRGSSAQPSFEPLWSV